MHSWIQPTQVPDTARTIEGTIGARASAVLAPTLDSLFSTPTATGLTYVHFTSFCGEKTVNEGTLSAETAMSWTPPLFLALGELVQFGRQQREGGSWGRRT